MWKLRKSMGANIGRFDTSNGFRVWFGYTYIALSYPCPWWLLPAAATSTKEEGRGETAPCAQYALSYINSICGNKSTSLCTVSFFYFYGAHATRTPVVPTVTLVCRYFYCLLLLLWLYRYTQPVILLCSTVAFTVINYYYAQLLLSLCSTVDFTVLNCCFSQCWIVAFTLTNCCFLLSLCSTVDFTVLNSAGTPSFSWLAAVTGTIQVTNWAHYLHTIHIQPCQADRANSF
jgi:hypothetical protein